MTLSLHMKILIIQKTTFQMPPYYMSWPEELIDMLAEFQNKKHLFSKVFCNELLRTNNYSETTTTIGGERVTIIKSNGLIPVQTVRSIL
jgi:hypothetical protein